MSRNTVLESGHRPPDDSDQLSVSVDGLAKRTCPGHVAHLGKLDKQPNQLLPHSAVDKGVESREWAAQDHLA